MNDRNEKPRRGRRPRPASTDRATTTPRSASTPRRRTSPRKATQQSLPLQHRPSWGGKRKGAGRKPTGTKAGIPHRPRPPLASRFPVHVTLRVRPDVWNLRSRRAFDARLAPAIAKGKETDAGFRLVHYTVQGNHLHLVCEGKNATVLARGIQGLAIRMAKGLNRMMGRKGRVFADRYHARILRTPREVRNVLAYVFRNFAKHFDEKMAKTGVLPERSRGPQGRARREEPGLIDPYSSARYFECFRGPVALPKWGPRDPPAGAEPKTWFLREGWQRAGPIRLV